MLSLGWHLDAHLDARHVPPRPPPPSPAIRIILQQCRFLRLAQPARLFPRAPLLLRLPALFPLLSRAPFLLRLPALLPQLPRAPLLLGLLFARRTRILRRWRSGVGAGEVERVGNKGRGEGGAETGRET